VRAGGPVSAPGRERTGHARRERLREQRLAAGAQFVIAIRRGVI
jgi:hypothetical protein